MSKQNTGGPAFPSSPEAEKFYNSINSGMTLRDYFAAKAMQGSRARNSEYKSWADMAADAYEIADAMLAERDKEQGE